MSRRRSGAAPRDATPEGGRRKGGGRAGAPPPRPLRVADVEPMLAERRSGPFSAAGWRFEIKLDGYRLLAGLGAAAGGDEAVTLLTRSGADWTDRFAELASTLAATFPDADAVLDGEVTVLDAAGRPSFSRLQRQRGSGAGLTSICWPKGARTCERCRSPSARIGSAGSSPTSPKVARCASWTTSPSGARRCSQSSRSWGSRG